MRGGTSKGIFFKKEDIPPEGSERDELIMKIFGSGDSSQIDGLGGAQTHTSKTMIVWKSDRPDVDLDYTFGQVGVAKHSIDWVGNCGNLTSAIAPFGLDEGLLKGKSPRTVVRIFNTNTKKRIDADVPVQSSVTQYEGDYRIDGVPNPGARINVKWFSPGGALTGKLLPTGNPVDSINIGTETIESSIVDAANPAVFVFAKAVGLTGKELPHDLSQASFMKLEAIRSKAAELMGFVEKAEEATKKSSHFPYIIILGEKQDYITSEGKTVQKSRYSILARVFSMQKMHQSYAVTAAICTGAAARIPNTIVNNVFEEKGDKVTIGHPKGVIDVSVDTIPSGESVGIKSVTVGRTARRLMSGTAYIISK